MQSAITLCKQSQTTLANKIPLSHFIVFSKQLTFSNGQKEEIIAKVYFIPLDSRNKAKDLMEEYQ